MPEKLPLVTDRRGPQRKRLWLEGADLLPVLHTRLLAGAQLTCCCGDPLTTDFYRFDVRSRTTGSNTHVAFAGTGCTRSLFAISQEIGRPIAPMRLFDPFAGSVRKNPGARDAGAAATDGVAWAALNRELSDAMNLFALVWDVLPGKILQDIRARIETYPERPYEAGVLSLNTIIGKFGGDRRSLTLRLDDLRVGNPELRQFPLKRMREVLEGRPNPDGTPRPIYL